MRTRALLIVAALGVGACKVGPNYERPTTPAPQAWHDSTGQGAATGAQRDTSFADLAWWSLFQDTTLQQLIRTSLAQNTDLLIAAERVTEATARLGITKSEMLPWIDASAGATRGGSGSRSSSYRSAGLGLSWEVDLFGRIRRGTERDRALLLATEEARRGVVLALVAGVATSYVALRSSDLQLEIAKRTADSRFQTVGLARQRFEGGVTGEMDYRQSQAQYEEARTIVVDLQEAIAQQENALSVLLGRAPGAIPRGRTVRQQPLPAVVPAGLPSALLDRRPDLRRAELELAASTANVGVAKALLFPNISLTGALGIVSGQLLGLTLNGDNAAWSIGGSIFQPIFQGGRLRNNVRVTESQMRQSALAYRSTVLNALREVEDALTGVRLAGDRTASLDSQVVYNRIALTLAETRYQGGVAQFLEVLDAQRTLLNTELSAATAAERRVTAIIDLYRSLGGGWQADSTAAPATPPNR
jgi:multidrug efflux system outer membrane protein